MRNFYKHNRTGDIYQVLARDNTILKLYGKDTPAVVYALREDLDTDAPMRVYVRTSADFDNKFTET